MAKAAKRGSSGSAEQQPKRPLEELLAEFKNYFGDAPLPAQLRARNTANREKDRKRAAAKHAGGRPPLDPDDLRSDRLGLRIHPDLRAELDRVARMDGMRLSMWVERALVKAVNERTGGEILDLIGRYQKSRR
jgi:hypothetical protein